MTSPEPASEPDAGGALSGAEDQRSAGDQRSSEDQRSGRDGHHEETSSNLSRVTDQVVDPDEDDAPSPEFVVHEGQPLDPNVQTMVWVIRLNGDKELLATYPGWRVRILDPFDVPQSRRFHLSDRRQVFAIFPRVESRVLRDSWPLNINRVLEKPWHGNVHFYEAQGPGDMFKPFGLEMPPSKKPPQGRGQPPLPPGHPGHGSSSSSSKPSSFGGGAGSAGHYKHQYGGPAVCAQQNKAAQSVSEFKMDDTDGDGRWHEVCEMDANDDDDESLRHVDSAMESSSTCEPTASKVFQLNMLKSCLKRRTPPSNRSPIAQLMSWSLSNAAQTFLHRIARSYGAQEEPDERSNKQSPGIYLCHDGQRGQERQDESKDGDSKVRDSMVSSGDSPRVAAQHHALTDGSGLPAEEGRGDRCGGHRERWGQEQEADQIQGQGESHRMDSSGHWQASETVYGTEVLGEGTQPVQPPSRVPTLQSQSIRPVVGVPEVRIPLGEVRCGPCGILDQHGGSRNTGLPKPEDRGGHVSPVLASSKIQAGSGGSGAEAQQGGEDRDGAWRHWINYNRTADDKPSGDRQGTIYLQRAPDDGTTCEPSSQEGASLSHRPRRDDGALGGAFNKQGGAHDQRRGERGMERRSVARRLVHKSQLGGKCGKALGSLLKTHFSKFMVFLCMNCCLAPTTVSAFGTPDLIAWHHDDEFTVKSTDDGFTEPDNFNGDYMTCYVYGHLAQHFASAQADGFGKLHQMNKDLNRRLVNSLRDNPNILEVYSPPRVTKKAEKFGFTAGGALDLSTGWDFCKPSHQKAALRLVNELQPVLIVLSPPCTTFSALRNLSNFKRDQATVAQEEAEGRLHVRFSVQLARIQLRAGRGFLFEHPRNATSWTTTELQQLRQQEGVHAVTVDLCRFGLTTSKGAPALKPTLLLTNIEELATVLHRRCEGFHKSHQPLLAGEAALAAKYTPAFVDAILRGLRQHVQSWVKSHHTSADYWEIKDEEVIRHHRIPRRALFSPKGVAGCPVELSKLSSGRTTTMKFEKGPVRTYSDNWRTTALPRQTMTSLWTGTTSFPVQDPILLPHDWQAAANFIVRAAAHPLHAYITEETAVQVEWTTAFPSHRILGGAPLSSTSTSSTAAPPQFNRFAGPAGDDLDVNMLDDVDMNVEEETSESKAKHALRALDLSKPASDNILHPELRRELFKIHRNLGHPSLQVFVRALKHAGVKNEVLQWTKNHFKCPICERKQQPSSHRPGKLQRAMNFNEVVGVDLIQINAPEIGDYWMLNCLCWGTDMQIVEIVKDKQASTVLETFCRAWIAHYGPPALVVADQGREFIGHQFTDYLGHLGVPVHFINARSPWENGRTERAGGIFKSRLEATLHEVGATTEDELRLCIQEVVTAHNRYYNRSGFTPYQRAFGTLPRMPASLLSDDRIDKQLVLEGAGDSMKRAWAIREEAAKAWLRWQDDESVRRAVSTRTRTSDAKDFIVGDLVYVWRNVPGFKGWTGPGSIVALKGETAWVSMRGFLMKVAIAQTRKATSEESLGAELVRHLSEQMLEDLESNAVKYYRDVEGEGLPDDGSEGGGYSPSLGPEEAEPLPGGDSPPEEAEPSPLAPIAEEPDAPMEEIQQAPVQPEGDDAMDGSSQVSTTEPSVAPAPSDGTSQPFSRMGTENTVPDRRLSGVRVDEGSGGTMGFGPVREGPSHAPAMPYPSPPQGIPSWPRPTHSLYFEVSSEPATKTPHWTLDRPTGKYTMNPPNTSKFNATEAEAVFNGNDQCMYLTKSKAKTSPGQVEFRHLPEKYKQIFRKSRAKEVTSLLNSGAIKILSVEESRKFAKEHPDHVLTSRYVDRWKPTDAFGVLPEEYDEPNFLPENHSGLAPKSRWCVVGWKDPHIHQIERAAPTPLTSSMYLALQLAASRKWVAFGKDAKTAFLQSRPTTRVQKLACKMPADEAFEGYSPEQLILLLTEVYGLVSGPAWWRRSLLELLVKELQYRVCVYDRCILTL